MGLLRLYFLKFLSNPSIEHIGFVTKPWIYIPYYFTFSQLFYPYYVTFVFKVSTDEHRKAYFKRIIEMEKRF